MRELPGVRDALRADDAPGVGRQDAGKLLPALLECVAEAGMSLSAVEVRKSNLETVFLHLTGRALRD